MSSRGDLSRQAMKAAMKAKPGEAVTKDDIRRQERRLGSERRAFQDDNYSRSRDRK